MIGNAYNKLLNLGTDVDVKLDVMFTHEIPGLELPSFGG